MKSKYNLIEKGKISSLQFAFLNITFVIATADVFLPAFVAHEARQDSWLSTILGTVSTLILILPTLALSMRHTGKSIMQYACEILGKPIGKLIGALYVYFYFFMCYAVTRELGEIFVTSFNPTAPISLYSILVIPVAAYAVYKGLEVIARLNDLLLPVGIFVLLFIGVINIPKLDFRHFLPILYNGMYPVLKGGLMIQTWLLEGFVALQLVPFVTDKKNIKKSFVVSLIILGSSLQIGVLTIAILGPLTAKVLFPALQYVKYASIGPYINNLDISIMIVWVSGIFIKIALSFYLAVLSLAQLFGLKSYKELVIPVGLLTICFSIALSDNISDIVYSLHYILPFYMLLMTFMIPSLLFIVSIIKDKLKNALSIGAASE